MGFAVVHLEKAKGSDSGMSAHIERTIEPKNADVGRSYLNREMIEFPDGVTNCTEAIQHRLETAGLKRKIASNQVRAIRVMLSGTHEDMKQIENDGKLDKWCGDNLDWLRQTYGTDNVVSAVLHLDEKTPHIHATVVPIVTTERKRRKREEGVKRNYRKKNPTPRLCADEIMSRIALKGYQDSYANVMSKYGLQRGIDGSEAKHISTSQYYRDLKQQSDSLQENITELLSQRKYTEKELSVIKANINKEKLKNSTADVGAKLMNGVSSLLGTPKMAKVELENRELKSKINDLQSEKAQITEILKSVTSSYEQRLQGKDSYIKTLEGKIATLTVLLSEEIKRAKLYVTNRLNRLFNLNSRIKVIDEMSEHCRKVGLSDDVIKILIDGKSLTGMAGELCHYEDTEVKIPFKDVRVEIIELQNGKSELMFNGTPSRLWLDAKREEKKQQNPHYQQLIQKSKGMRI